MTHQEFIARTQAVFPGAHVVHEATYETQREAVIQLFREAWGARPVPEKLSRGIAVLRDVVATTDGRTREWAARFLAELEGNLEACYDRAGRAA